MSTKVKTLKKTRDVIHDVFFDAAHHIDDGYWQNFFIDLSKGKQSRKIHIDDKHVSHTGKKKSFNYCYEGKSSEEIAIELKKLISDTLCIYSDGDMTFEREELDLMASEFKDAKKKDDWKKVNNKKMKDHLITTFVLAKKNEFEYSWSQTRYLYNTVRNAIHHYSTHKSQDITMVDGEIISIDDITITKDVIANERWCLIDANQDTKPSGNKKISLEKEWMRVCNNISKRSKLLLCLEEEEEKAVKKKKILKPDETKGKRKGKNKKEQIEEELDEGIDEGIEDEKEVEVDDEQIVNEDEEDEEVEDCIEGEDEIDDDEENEDECDEENDELESMTLCE